MRGRGLEKTGGVTYYTLPPHARQDPLLPENTLRIVSGRERRRCLQIVCRGRMA